MDIEDAVVEVFCIDGLDFYEDLSHWKDIDGVVVPGTSLDKAIFKTQGDLLEKRQVFGHVFIQDGEPILVLIEVLDDVDLEVAILLIELDIGLLDVV